jgi:hypothetical protein
MPVFDPGTPMTTRRLAGSTYGYSGTRLDALGSAEYTLVAIAADQSGSVSAFKTEIERCLGEIVRACNTHARADQLMLRLVAFDDQLGEVHGFKPLPTLDAKDYAGCLRIGGSTALYDAALNAVASVTSYGDTLAGADFAVNGLVFVLTDGEDNASSVGAADVKRAVDAAIASERLDSIRTVLVGVGVGGATSASLMRFSAAAGFDDYVAIETADAASLERLARFASRSIALQSSALGSGSSTVSLKF